MSLVDLVENDVEVIMKKPFIAFKSMKSTEIMLKNERDE
jgi:hypothetical protein